MILLTEDDHYVFAHDLGKVFGPFTKQDLPFNVAACVGGKIHKVDNPIVIPPELITDQ